VSEEHHSLSESTLNYASAVFSSVWLLTDVSKRKSSFLLDLKSCPTQILYIYNAKQ